MFHLFFIKPSSGCDLEEVLIYIYIYIYMYVCMYVQHDSKRWTQFRMYIFPDYICYVNDLHNI